MNKRTLTPGQLVAAFSDVKFHLIPAMVVKNYKNGQSVEGQLMFTEGMDQLIGMELVGFGHPTVDDLRGSAQMIHANNPRGVFTVVDEFVYSLVDEWAGALEFTGPRDIPYRQYVMDESVLDDEKEAVSGDPQWVPDGGQSLLDDDELQECLTHHMNRREKETHDRIELVRQQFRDKIDELGFAMTSVFHPTNQEPSFLYTMGLTNKDLPELIIGSFLPVDAMQDFVAYFGKQFLADGAKLVEMKDVFQLEDDESFNLRLVAVDPFAATANWMGQAEPVLGKPVKHVVWIQISDAKGRYPGDEDFDNKFSQPDFAPVIAK